MLEIHLPTMTILRPVPCNLARTRTVSGVPSGRLVDPVNEPLALDLIMRTEAELVLSKAHKLVGSRRCGADFSRGRLERPLGLRTRWPTMLPPAGVATI